MIIDGHAHACGEYFDYESIIKILDSNKADKVVLCPGEANNKKTYGLPILSERFPQKDIMFAVNRVITFVTKMTGVARHIDEQNEYVFTLSKMSPDRIVQAYWINPLDKNCMKKLNEDFEKYRFKLIKVHQCWNEFDIPNENLVKIIEWALEKDLPIFIHISTKTQVDAFIQVANKYEESKFIVAHLIGYESISEHIKNDNVYYDISPPQLISLDRLKNAIDKVGASKLILGSDTPYGKNNLQMNIEQINGLDISEIEKKLIKGGNLYKLLFRQ